MCLLYLDDSGSAANPTEDYVVLGGVSVYEAQVHHLTTRLDALAQELFPDLPPTSVEFHASVVFSGRQAPWNRLRSKEERIHVIRQVLDLFAESYDSARAFAMAIHKASFPNHDYMHTAFEDLCSRFDLYLNRQQANGRDRDRGLLVLDKSSYETSLQRLAHDFRLQGTRWRILRNIVEVPLFVESHASRLIQMADHVAYAVFRRYNAGDTSYLDRIINKFDAYEGVIHGLVHKQSVDPACKCPACLSRALQGSTVTPSQ